MAKNTKNKNKIPPSVEYINEGWQIINQHQLFGRLEFDYRIQEYDDNKKSGSAFVTSAGYIVFNKNKRHSPQEWAYIIAHLMLHLSLGHTNPDKVSKSVDIRLWNIACDIYITKFLQDIKFSGATMEVDIIQNFPGSLRSEQTIYEYLTRNIGQADFYTVLGTYANGCGDIFDLEDIWDKPVWRWRSNDYFEKKFAYALQHSVKSVLQSAASAELLAEYDTRSRKAANWFINSFPLLGGLAAHFRIIEDSDYCQRNEIQIAAVDVSLKEIYVNSAAGLTDDELIFVLAHEYLHAGLDHADRAKGRDHYLWNVACDYVVNGWLREMHIGTMPENGLLYDETLSGMSAEEIYDELVRNIRTTRKLMTFRGYGKGDIIGSGENQHGSVSLDDFCKNALMQGLEYHISSGRGLIPEGLIEEIKALAMPPIPWDVKLAKWFDDFFVPVEKHRTYARPSRRQASTPDIPRPRYFIDDTLTEGRTFGVVIDTSGSMSAKDIGIALGAIASYADSKDVPKVRVIFCDADAYDNGYMSPEEIAGRVEVVGRGGTILQPGIDLLESAKNFPKDAPILIITDGYIERDLKIKREHAFLIPEGHILPFRPCGKVFYYGK
ncbi:MAG: hypothetical protein PUG48_02075 [Clostridia bacterium]|nr:hypothetical protein [Clostridia bacterium]